jgi:hypothetical protein
MTYENSREEKQAIQRRLEKLVEDEQISLLKLSKRFKAWAKDNERDYASRETLDSWMCSDFSDGKDPNWHSEKLRAFKEFIKSQPDLNSQQSVIGTLNHLLESHFHAPHGMPHSYLNSLCGEPFAMFRRLWSKPESNLYIRSIVTFTNDDGVILYEEKQDFSDPVKNMHRTETDHGFVQIFGFNLYILSLGAAVHSMKFLVIHDSDPALDGKTKTGICKGNMIAVAGKGPHPGFKFIMRRIVGADTGSRIVSENDLDADTKGWLAG